MPTFRGSPGFSSPKLKAPKLKAMKQTGFNPQPGGTSMFGNRAMKSPEDYETAEGVAGLGRVASPYFAQQFAQKGRALKYDTATNTFR